MSKIINKKSEQEMLEGFNGILESEKERRKMSPTRLAIRLSDCEKDSPAYILFKHELNLKIANVQATATYVGAMIGVIGSIIGIIIGSLLTIWIQNQ